MADGFARRTILVKITAVSVLSLIGARAAPLTAACRGNHDLRRMVHFRYLDALSAKHRVDKV
ncbi:MAG: hypothetical protein WA820_07645, partial [Bradyrhizobium sp.]